MTRRLTTTLALCAALAAAFALPAVAQAPACNEGRFEGAASAALAQCISRVRAEHNEIQFQTTCACPDGGATVVVTGTPHCRPNEPCPLIVIPVGTVVLDCEGNVISAQCTAFPTE